ncbi:MAG: hypothetical protein B6U78_01785 [Candidatus Aenigmarchaeota archaeon ex4484_224]|nr:MAG: hypothetical protein B6U78_01785 [Candidatus Aenigmarchaeota archaeon ex4484_224]
MVLNKKEICLSNYQKWKNLAFQAKSLEDVKKFMKRAFFWIELSYAFEALEKAEKDFSIERKKLIQMKVNLSKKLIEYTKNLLKEI